MPRTGGKAPRGLPRLRCQERALGLVPRSLTFPVHLFCTHYLNIYLSPAVICPLQPRPCCYEVCLTVLLLWVHLARLSVPEFASTCLLCGHCSFCVLGAILPPGTHAASASQRLTSLSSSLCEYSVLPSPPHVLQQHARHLPSPRLRCSGQHAALK